MRFAYLCCDFGVPLFGTGGSSIHLQEITRALRKSGHEVMVFSPNLGAASKSTKGEDFHHVPLDGFAACAVNIMASENLEQASHLPNELRALLYSEHSQQTLYPLLSSFQPDMIYERYSLFSYAGVELARRLKVPLVLEVNAPLRQEQAKYRQLLLERTAEELEREIFNRADALIVVSTALADYAQQLGVPLGKITVLPN